MSRAVRSPLESRMRTSMCRVASVIRSRQVRRPMPFSKSLDSFHWQVAGFEFGDDLLDIGQ